MQRPQTTSYGKPSIENYNIGKVIGQGAYAHVRICQHKKTMQKFALKIYDKHRLNDPMKRKAVQREIMVMRKLNHPNVVKLHELIDMPKQVNFVMDYVKGISLQ